MPPFFIDASHRTSPPGNRKPAREMSPEQTFEMIFRPAAERQSVTPVLKMAIS